MDPQKVECFIYGVRTRAINFSVEVMCNKELP